MMHRLQTSLSKVSVELTRMVGPEGSVFSLIANFESERPVMLRNMNYAIDEVP